MAEIVSMYTAGLKELQERLRQLGPRGRQSVKRTLVKKAENIITDAQRHYVPVQFGVLKGSGLVSPPEETANEISVGMGFGGAASAYALAVHEHLSEHSPRSWKIAERGGKGVHFRVGGPKYLELPFLAATTGGKLEQAIAEDLEAEWNRATS